MLALGLAAMGGSVETWPETQLGAVPSPADAAAIAQPSGAPADPSPPLRLHLPDLGVDAAIMPIGVEPDGALEVPDDPDVVGWWRDGALPGAVHGTVVIDGHVDTHDRGPGALFRIDDLRPEDQIVLGTDGGERAYVVRAIRRYSKDELPAEVFDRSGGRRLVLISCGGEFDQVTRHYAENIVVYAVPAPSA